MKNSTLAALSLAVVPVLQSPAASDGFQHRGAGQSTSEVAPAKSAHGSGCGHKAGGGKCMGSGGKSCCANKSASTGSSAPSHEGHEAPPDHSQHSH